jgi:hypothetical protein
MPLKNYAKPSDSNHIRSEFHKDRINALAEIIVESYLNKPLRKKTLNSPVKFTKPINFNPVSFEEMLSLLGQTEREEAEERVSILEFDGKISRTEAEKIVIQNLLKSNKYKNKIGES